MGNAVKHQAVATTAAEPSALDEKVPSTLANADALIADTPLDPEQILSMKLSGKPKPSWITWTEWEQPQRLNHRHRLVIDMAATGATTRQIAEAIGVTPEYVRRLVRSPIIRDAIDARMESVFNTRLKKKMEPIAEAGLEQLKSILDDPNARASSKVEAIKLLLGHTLGKVK